MKLSDNKLLQLHLIILIWGFTPVIGKFISLQAIDLVWYRLLFASISLFLYIKYKKNKPQTRPQTIWYYPADGGNCGFALVLFLPCH